MACRRQTCLVSSDEEDEDGNLKEVPPGKSNTVPQGEVVYLPEDTSNFKPEGEEIDRQLSKERGNVSGTSIKIKTIDSLRNTPGSNNSSSENVGKSSSLKADNLMPPTVKRDNTNIVQNNSFKKAKYARQATPICDAIMKEYSKRQRIIKQKGSAGTAEVSDTPIQELLKKAKDKGGTEVNVEKEVSSKNTNAQAVKVTPSEETREEKINDPLIIVKQEIIDVKPEVVYVPVNSAEVKQEKCDLVPSSPSSNESPSVRGRGRGRGRGRAGKWSSQRKRKWQISDDEDDTDEDPDFDPSTDKITTRRVTRYNRRSAKCDDTHEKDQCVDQVIESPDFHTSELSTNRESLVLIPKDRAINVAERLKSLAEKIADVLTKDPSPNINSEAEKLLLTTQELIELQKKSLQNSDKGSLPGSTIKIKQEMIDESENNNETNSLALVENPTTSTTNQPKQNAVQIYNQLQKHEAALQKKLSESIPTNDQVLNITERETPTNFQNTGSVISGPVNIKEKCTFIMDFFTSYQEVFDEYTINHEIPKLSDSIMLCFSELTECIQRTKKAEAIKSLDVRQQEINMAKQSYLKTIVDAGESFFPIFNNIVGKISRTKTSKALINTLMLAIAGSLFMKTQKLKSNMHRFRRVLLFMTKAHNQYHPLVSQVLQTPENVFDSETKLIKHLLKYFQARKFLKIPAEFFCAYPDVSFEEDKQYQVELSIMDTAILEHINSVVNVVDRPVESTLGQNYNHPEMPSSSTSSAISQLRRSNITSELIEALRNEGEGNTKRIEEKLDYILNVLSGNVESLGINMNTSQNKPAKDQTRHGKETVRLNKQHTSLNFDVRVNLGKRVPNVPTVKLSLNQEVNTSMSVKPKISQSQQPASLSDDKGMLLAQLLEEDHVGLDSLFSSYLKSSTEKSTVRIKSEPLDIAETTIDSAQPHLIPIKLEPSEVFFTEIGAEQPNTLSVCEQPLLEDPIFNDSFTEEYNFTKTEQDFSDVDPLT